MSTRLWFPEWAVRRERSVPKSALTLVGDRAIAKNLRTRMWAHQIHAFRLVCRREATWLALDMGTGKSLAVVASVSTLPVRNVMICAPKSALRVWPSEFEKHSLDRIHVEVIDKGSGIVKAEKIRDTIDWCRKTNRKCVIVINYESVWRTAVAPTVAMAPWDMVVLDESHKIKSASSKCSRFLHKVGALAPKRVCLTGTPLPHSPLDAFGQARFLDTSLFGFSFTSFRARYAITNPRFPSQVVGFTNRDEMNERLQRIMWRVEASSVLDLPPITEDNIMVEIPPAARSAYRAMERDFIAELEVGEITAANAAVKILRLQQIASGTAPDAATQIPIELHRAKRDALVDHAEGIDAKDPIIIFCRFRADMDQAHDAMRRLGRKSYELSGRKNELADWQSSKGGDAIVVQIQSGGAGIDLTRARYVYYFSVGHSLGDYKQSLARAHRPGQTRHVSVYHIVAEDTVDVLVYRALRAREAVVERVMKAIKERSYLSEGATR